MTNFSISVVLKRLFKAGIDLDWYAGKRVLVTGGAGFIGSWLVEALVNLKADVYVVDNLWRGSIDNLKKEDGTYSVNIQDHFFEEDLQDFEAALSVCNKSKPDLVFHLADIVAGVDFVFANEPFVFRVNNLINSNLFTAANRCGVERVVYLGTACSYPKMLQEQPGGLPLVEEQMYPADPESAYGWSKLMGEYELELLGRFTNMQVGILRLHNVYGPRSILSKKRSQVIPSLIRKAICHPLEELVVWGTGQQTRDFVFVGDVVDAILRSGLNGMNKGPIQIASGYETALSDLVSMIVQISGKEIPIQFDTSKPQGDRGRCGNNEKAKRQLGWQVTTSLEEGLRYTYDWAEEMITQKKVDLDE